MGWYSYPSQRPESQSLPTRQKLLLSMKPTAAISKVRIVTRHGARPRNQPNNVDILSLIAALQTEMKRPIKIDWIKAIRKAISTRPTQRRSRPPCHQLAELL